ncbi:MAG: UvrD-helicase domain-containing protein [Chloroflexi bacterium]|nr:UvrD-helicase domain-containing protein [Chloroflexota bacterium]
MDDLLAALDALIAAIVLRGGSGKNWGGDEVFTAAKKALTELKEQAKAVQKTIGERPGPLDEQAAALIRHWAALAERAQIAYQEAKKTRAALDFDDLERMTARLLQNDGVRSRYIEGEIHAVLVDEFQDTNTAQWQIARALTAGRPGALFVVGDPKQTIYAFRGADVTVFKDVAGRIVHDGGERVDLAESFRTHAALVGTFNALFPRLLKLDSRYDVEYDTAMAAGRLPPVDAAPLECLLIEKPPRDRDKDDEEAGAREREAEQIAVRLRTLVETEQRRVYDKASGALRPVRYGDVAVLFQAMTNAPLYEAAFKAASVPYVTVAGKGFYDRQEIWDALNLLRAVYSPGDDLAVASTLRSPLFAVSDDGMLWLRLSASPAASVGTTHGSSDAHDDTERTAATGPHSPRMRGRDGQGGRGSDHPSFWDCLYTVPLDRLNDADRDAVVFARETLAHLRALAGRVSIADLLREAYALTGYLTVLTALPGGVRLRANAEKLVALAEANGGFALGAFLDVLADLKAQEAREGEAALDAENAVKLMTVHKSKGLEFPVVVLADCSYKFGGQRDYDYAACDPELGWSCRLYDDAEAKYIEPYAVRARKAILAQKETAEKRRLLYVAATRAADLLIVSGQVEWDKNGVLKASGWLDWLIEALAVGDLRPDETERQTPVGRAALHVHVYAPDGDGARAMAEDNAGEDGWFDALWKAESSPAAPPLVGPIALDPRRVRDLTVTQLGDLGSALYALPETSRPFFRERWARGVYGRAPAPIETVSDRPRRSRARLVGEIVHRAIQYGIPDGRADVPRLLGGYAWEMGVVDDAECNSMVAEAADLLDRVRRREVFAWLEASREAGRQVYRELPFVFTTPDRTIHGIIDMLIERADGTWAVVDFKTSLVAPAGAPPPSYERVAAHARRYHIQVGVYALAVEAQLGVLPAVYLDYIQHNTLVPVAEADWRAALGRLEEDIGSLFGEDGS